MDCGGVIRHVSTCSLQAWVADGVEYRITAGKLAEILDRAASILGDDEPMVEIEAELISQFPVEDASAANGVISFRLGTKHTDCLARDACLTKDDVCCGGPGC